jgi:hypothetical protein
VLQQWQNKRVGVHATQHRGEAHTQTAPEVQNRDFLHFLVFCFFFPFFSRWFIRQPAGGQLNAFLFIFLSQLNGVQIKRHCHEGS